MGTPWLRSAVAVAFCVALAGCADRDQCEAALEVICSCASRPCDAEEPPAIVRAMQRCDEEDVRPDDQENNVHICIDEAGDAFCAVLDGVTAQDESLCEVEDCTVYGAACTNQLARACTEYQFASCDVPEEQ